jgi:hypothetical protein
MNQAGRVLTALAIAASVAACGSARADPDTDCLAGHKCIVPPEGGQGEAAQRAREGDKAQEQGYLSWLRNQGHVPTSYADADAVSRGREACDTLRDGMGQSELIGELVAGGRLNRDASADIVRSARTYFCPGVVAGP